MHSFSVPGVHSAYILFGVNTVLSWLETTITTVGSQALVRLG
jgi:hypothetical protein